MRQKDWGAEEEGGKKRIWNATARWWNPHLEKSQTVQGSSDDSQLSEQPNEC